MSDRIGGKSDSKKDEAGSAIPIKVSGERPESWTHTEVEDWLKRIKCAEFSATFREKDMDGVALSGLYRCVGMGGLWNATVVWCFVAVWCLSADMQLPV